MSKSKVFAAICLSSLLLLGACGGSKEESMSKTSSSAKVTKQVKKSETKKTEKSSSQTKKSEKVAETEKSSQVESSTSANTEQENQETSPEATPSAPTVQPGGMNTLAMRDSLDFSSIAGTWTNDQGYTFVFDAAGNVTFNGHPLKLALNRADGNGAFVTIGADEGVASPVGIVMKPAGTQHNGIQDNRDRMYSGQSAEDLNHPFYKVQ